MTTTVDMETGEITEHVEEPVETVETPDDDEHVTDPEPEPEEGEEVDEIGDEQARQEAQAEETLSQKEIEAKIKKLEQASERYTKRVAEILGDDLADYFPTPLSEPFLFGFVVRPDLRPIPAEVVDATKLLIGEPVPPPYKQAAGAHTCPDCDGWGSVLTGSKVAGKQTMTCRNCQGRGTVGDAFNVTPADYQTGATPTVDFAEGHKEPLLPEDAWGTPLGHPDYGKMPNYRDEGWAEALEAYRRGEAPTVG